MRDPSFSARALLALPLVALVALALPVERARACSCLARDPSELVASAAIVFEGMVRRIEREPTPGEFGARSELVVTFEVVQAWRGVASDAEELVVRTAETSASCGVPFELGRGYIVLAQQDEGRTTASLCDGTTAAEDADPLRRVLGSGTIPVRIEDEPADEPSGEGARERRQARGGCASCSAHGGAPPVSVTIALGALFFALRRRSRR